MYALLSVFYRRGLNTVYAGVWELPTRIRMEAPKDTKWIGVMDIRVRILPNALYLRHYMSHE